MSNKSSKPSAKMHIIVSEKDGVMWHVIDVKDGKVYTHEWQNACLAKDKDGKHSPLCKPLVSRVFDTAEFESEPQINGFLPSTPEEIAEQKKLAASYGEFTVKN